MLCFFLKILYSLVKIFIENELDKEISNESTIFPEYEILIEEESVEADLNDFDQESIFELIIPFDFGYFFV